MRSLLLIFTAVFFVCALASPPEKANFSGTWVRDPTHGASSHTAGDRGITSVLPTIIGGGTSPNDGTVDVNRNETDPDDYDALAEKWIETLNMTIVQTEGELQIMRQFFAVDGTQKTVTQKFALDGSRSINLASDGRGEFESRTDWRNGKLVNSGIQTIAVRQITIEASVTEEFSISKDGKRLTIERKSITPQGVAKIKQVFNKKKV